MAFTPATPPHIHPHPITAGLIDHRRGLVLPSSAAPRPAAFIPFGGEAEEAEGEGEEAEEEVWWEKTISSHRCDHDLLQDHPRWE